MIRWTQMLFIIGAIVLGIALSAAPLPATLPSQAILSGGCCPGAVWTPDSRALLFLDGPPVRPSTGIYQVAASGGPVTRRFSSVAFYSKGLRWAVRPGSGLTTLERLADGRKFTLPTRGADVVWSPAEDRLAFMQSDTSGNYDRRRTRVLVADAFGAPKQVAVVYGGGATAWLDETTLLMTGKANPSARDRDLFTLNTRTGARTWLRTALNFRSVSLSPGGGWVAYTITFDDPARNGLWLQPTSGGPPRKLPEFGSLRWRDAARLLLIPLRPDGSPNVLKQYDLRAQTWTTLGNLGGQIRQGDWAISPDGTRLSFLSAQDGNLRVLKLP